MNKPPVWIVALTAGALTWVFMGSEKRESLVQNTAQVVPGLQVTSRVVKKSDLAQVIPATKDTKDWPREVMSTWEKQPQKIHLEYTFDDQLQTKVGELLRQYAPDYASIVAMDASTGKIRVLQNFSREDPNAGNLAVKATFPAASVFKIVTAAAAMSEKKINHLTEFSHSGRNSTLYRNQVFREVSGKWARSMTLQEAFSKSVNSIFGKIGATELGYTRIETFADRFKFGKDIPLEIDVQRGRFSLPEDPWKLAEVSSGYTTSTTMSPLQAAMIAATVANDGVMVEPSLVERAVTEEGKQVYQSNIQILGTVIEPAVAYEMKELMRETIRSGTSRKSFKGFLKGSYKDIDVGGKTGSLTGFEPSGKYDWYVGYANDSNGRKLAISVMTINKTFWRVKSAYLARRLVELYYAQVRSSLPIALQESRAAPEKASPRRSSRRHGRGKK